VVTGRRPFSVLIADGRGRPVLRLSVSHRTLYGGLACLALSLVASALAVAGYVSATLRQADVVALARAVEAERRRGDEADRRLAQIQDEIRTWHTVHARIWKPLGPPPAVTPRDPDAADGVLALVQAEGEKLRALEPVMSRVAQALAVLPAGWPVRAAINSGFGRRRSPWGGPPEFHRGLDLATPIGTPVHATAPGIVAFAGRTPDYGNLVVLDRGLDVRTRFGHLHRIQARPGQRVERGEQIALSGNTGMSTGPHLHYEVVVKGRPIDPRFSLE
jgi:murein DD-endopeptidase MepM/ murein hydrolase activator NlpD